MKKIFQHSPKDLYLILYTLFMLSVPLTMAYYSPPFIWWCIIGFFHVWFIVNQQNSPLHHHSHWPTFVNKKYNQIYELFLSAASGIPHQIWKSAHLIHHKHVNDRPKEPGGNTIDGTSVYRNSLDGTPVNFWIYCFCTVISMIKNYLFDCGDMHITRVPKFFNRYKKESWAIRIFLLLIISINFKYGIFLCIIYILSYIVNNANSYGEHYGALHLRGDTTRDSVGIYSQWYNIFGFNAGYHQEHHHKPGKHWTQLPEITKLLPQDRHIVGKIHILNNPFWSHFKLLFKK